MRRILTGVVVLCGVIGMAGACSEIDAADDSSSASSSHTVVEYKDMPNLQHMSLEKAVSTLRDEGWNDIEAVEKDNDESTIQLDKTGYHVVSQKPYSWETGVGTDTHIQLTVHKDMTRTISNLVSVGESWNEAFDKLRSAGLDKDCDYILVGGSMGDYSQYYVKRVSDGNADTLPGITVETYQDKQRHEEQTQNQNQSGQEAHGGAFCSTEGEMGVSDSSDNILTCRESSDGRLRWMN